MFKNITTHNIDLALSRGETFDFGPLINLLTPNNCYLHSAYESGALKLSFENDQLVILVGDQTVCELEV